LAQNAGYADRQIRAIGERGRQQESTSFLKKRSKKLLGIWATGRETSPAKSNQKVFCALFKKALHPLLDFHGGLHPVRRHQT
jgi:hypothetical protein